MVGSALVDLVKANLDESGNATSGLADKVLAYVHSLADSIRGARGA